jgi:predicted transposase YbfD/YdcC
MNPTTAVLTIPAEDGPVTLDLGAIQSHFQTLPDARKRRGLRYPLAVLLTVAVLAKLAGASDPAAIAQWAKERAVALVDLFDLARLSMPHPSTWSRVLGTAVAVNALTHVIARLTIPRTSAEVPARGTIPCALDGKTLRGTIPAGSSRGVHLLALYQPDAGVVIAQQAVDGKTNEIGAAPTLLAGRDLTGLVVSGDAMHTQRELSTQIVEAGGDYFWWVKENQPTLLDDLVLLFEDECVQAGWSAPPVDFTSARTVEVGHGRIEERVLTASSMLADYADWPYLAQAVKLERWRTIRGQTSYEVAYGVTSLPAAVADAARLLALGRGHWQIENGLHYRRDVTLGEDGCQTRRGQAPEVLAALNNLVCAIGAPQVGANLAAFQRSVNWHLDQWLAQRGWERAPHRGHDSRATGRVFPHRR